MWLRRAKPYATIDPRVEVNGLAVIPDMRPDDMQLLDVRLPVQEVWHVEFDHHLACMEKIGGVEALRIANLKAMHADAPLMRTCSS